MYVNGDQQELILKLVVAICSARDWKPQFGMALAGLIAYTCTHLKQKLELFDLQVYSNCSNICKGRQFAIDDALRRGFTHVLFLDDDMTFTPELVERLIEHDADMVGVNYSQKTKEGVCTALGVNGRYVKATAGVLPVLRLGFGVLLVRLALTKKIPRPHFEMKWSDHHQMVVGEDYYFSDLMAKAGATILCDLNIKVGHIGDYEYMLRDPLFASVKQNADQRPDSQRPEEAA